MNDFDYDCLQRKHLAQQAKYRKIGSKSKSCRLPSDNLTKKQWKERCGTMITYKLNAPMGWKDFKSLTRETQEEYISNLQDKYGATMSNLAEMFHVSPTTVRKYMADNKMNAGFKVGHSMTAAQRVIWDRFLNPVEENEENKDACAPEKPSAIEPKCLSGSKNTAQVSRPAIASKESPIKVEKFDISFSGEMDINTISNSLRNIIGNKAVGRMSISCELEGGISCEQ